MKTIPVKCLGFNFLIRMNYTTIGHKSIFTRIRIVGSGLALLGLINYQLFTPPNFMVIVAIVVFGFMMYLQQRILNKMRYTFSEEGILIDLPSKKKFMLTTEHIESVEKVKRARWKVSLGTSYNFFTKEISFATSHEHLLKIVMKDGRHILISPRTMKDGIEEFYTKK